MNRKQANIDWQRLSIRLFLTLIAPVSIALLLDWMLATLPILTMLTGLVCIPLATFVVLRTTLSELDRVIAAVAPPDLETDQDVAIVEQGSGSPDASA